MSLNTPLNSRILHRIRRSQRQTSNLATWVLRSLPETVCQLPKVLGEQVPAVVLLSNIKAIREAWILSRQIGVSTLQYSYDSNQFLLHPDLIERTHAAGEITVGLSNSYYGRKDSLAGEKGYVSDQDYFTYQREKFWPFFCMEDPYLQRARPLISCRLQACIDNYELAQDHITQKITKSYARLVALEGLDLNNAPLVKKVREKITKDLKDNADIVAPVGSTLDEVGISLADMDKVLVPLREAIAAESHLPMWLIFNIKPDISGQLEERANFLTNQFINFVYQPLVEILACQGYSGGTIIPPSYRDTFYDQSILASESDSYYKTTAGDRNTQLAEQVEIKNYQTKALIEKVGAAESLGLVKPGSAGAGNGAAGGGNTTGSGNSDSQGLSVGRVL